MSQSVNLIPQQEVQEQTKTKLVKFSTFFTILLLIIVGSVSAYYFNIKRNLTNQITAQENEITRLRSEITSLAPIEVSARNLYKKYTVISEILTKRRYFSALMRELDVRKPATISIDSANLQIGNQLDISGMADNYITIANFTNNLLNTNFEGGDPELKNLFGSVSLTSVRLEQEKGVVRFAILVHFNESDLQK